jgi:thiamine-monophosphate kinase
MDKEALVISKIKSDYIGDDGAVVGEYIYSMDAFFEGSHFKREWMSMAQIGRKAMLVNISDAIAMNAKALYALVTLALPKDITIDEIEELTDSLSLTAREFGCEIIGGDTISSDKLHISITIISKSDNPLRRVGLKSGDLLAYTGTLGDSKKGLDRLFMGEILDKNERFFEPKLRSEFISRARDYLRVGMDISDGLFCDTNKILDANSLGLELIDVVSDEVGLSGEEYEMLIGFDSAVLDDVLKVAKETNTPLSIFAKVVDDNTLKFECQNHHF